MSYNIIAVPEFSRQLKKLSKKYRSLKAELSALIEELQENPTLGIPLAEDVYKIRLAVASKGKGKSGGARIITYVQIDNKTILFLSIYNKGEKDNISVKALKELLDKYGK